jgi:hypothetical protein
VRTTSRRVRVLRQRRQSINGLGLRDTEAILHLSEAHSRLYMHADGHELWTDHGVLRPLGTRSRRVPASVGRRECGYGLSYLLCPRGPAVGPSYTWSAAQVVVTQGALRRAGWRACGGLTVSALLQCVPAQGGAESRPAGLHLTAPSTLHLRRWHRDSISTGGSVRAVEDGGSVRRCHSPGRLSDGFVGDTSSVHRQQMFHVKHRGPN